MNNRKPFDLFPKVSGGLLKHFFKSDDSVNGASLLPIRLTLLYLMFSVAVYSWGPFDWTTQRPFLFYTLLVLYMIALWFGYRIGVKKRFSKSIDWKVGYIEKIIPILSVLIVANYLIYIVNIFREYGLQTFDFPELFRQMAIGIKNPGVGYSLRQMRIDSILSSEIIGGQLFSLFNYVWSFVRYPILLLGMLNFKKLKIWGKVSIIFYLITMFLFYLSIGTTIDILHVFLLLELPVILNTLSSWYKREINKTQIVKLIISLLAGVLLVLSYFTWMMVSRGGINNYDNPEYNVGGVHLNENISSSETPFESATETPSGVTSETPSESTTETPSGVTSETPSESTTETPSGVTSETPAESTAEPPVELTAETPSKLTGIQISPTIMKFWISFSSYFTQGYYGMAQAITQSWTPMFGLGSSKFVVDFVSEHVYDIEPFTYQAKNEEAFGWDPDVQWNCMYTWLANDFSFYGVVIVMFLIGILFSAMFKDAISTENPFAKISVFYFILMMLFIPCNNQIAQRPDTLFSFALIVFCWLMSKYPPKVLKKHFQGKN